MHTTVWVSPTACITYGRSRLDRSIELLYKCCNSVPVQWFAAHLEQSAIVKKTITHLWYSCGKPQCTLEFVPYMDMAYGCYTVVIIYYAHT